MRQLLLVKDPNKTKVIIDETGSTVTFTKTTVANTLEINSIEIFRVR